MPTDSWNLRKITAQQYRALAVRAQSHIASLPDDDLLAHLDVEVPMMAKHSTKMSPSAVGLFTWDIESSIRPPKASLASILAILVATKQRGATPDQLEEILSLTVASGDTEANDAAGQRALLAMVNEYDPGKYPHTKMGFFDFFVDLHGHKIRYCRDNRECYVYADGVWIANRQDRIQAMVDQTIRSLRGMDELFLDQDVAKEFAKFQRSLESGRTASTAVGAIRSSEKLWIAESDLDAKLFLLNLPNGTYDLEADRFRDHDPADHVTRMSPVTYDSSAKCPNFERMVSDLFGGDQDTIRYVQSVLGYCLSGDTSAKRLWVFYGPTADNGKSTLLRVMKAVLGDESRGYYGSIYFETLMAKGRDTKNLGIASLDYKPRVATVDELPKECCLNAGIVKAITGDTTGLSARRNFQDPTTHEVTYKLVIATNHLPTFDSFDEGIKNRITVIPFNQKFARVKDFDQRWECELAGILNWLIDGFREYTSSGLDTLPPAVRKATDEAVGHFDPLGLFLATCTESVDGEVTRVSDLRAAYKAWLKAHGYPDNVGPKDMSKALASHGHQSGRSNANGLGGVTAVRGLRLLSRATTGPKSNAGCKTAGPGAGSTSTLGEADGAQSKIGS